jgi:hypothetical protein
MKKLKTLKHSKFLSHTRFNKVHFAVFAVIFAAIGGFLLLHSFAAGTGANLWVDTNGGTCTRQATAGAYVDAQACGSLNAAYAAASPGDLVLVKPGTYTASFTGSKSGTTQVQMTL